MDLCCGIGAVTRALAEQAPVGALIVGVDFSRGMLDRALIAAREAGRSSIRWVQADATDLPFRAGTFDAVTCAYALYELKGEARGVMLREAARVLSPGGRFLAMEHEVPERSVPRLLFYLRLAVIGAEGARAFLGGEVHELGRVFQNVVKDVVPPGKSKILTGTKPERRTESQESRAETKSPKDYSP
jgi:demethylmenaquinone methyltransferase/2-methoxy-6-polyprenyl-1,4-benzoquinol methylase